jgi:hypothetical protein
MTASYNTIIVVGGSAGTHSILIAEPVSSVALLIPFPPGETRVSGIEFPTTVRNMQGGTCQPASASLQSDVS